MTAPLAWHRATSADVPALVGLVQTAYRGPGGWTNEIGLVEGRRIDAAQLGELVLRDDAIVVVAEHDGIPVGCCEVDAGADGIAHFGLFAVDPRRQGAGLGRALVTLARELAVERFGAHTLQISVVSGQEPLMAWYRRLGFVPTGTTLPFGDDPRDRAVVPGLHFVVMRAPLVRAPWVLSWSGGKDSALALQAMRGAGGAGPLALITTVTADHDRVSMHGVRRSLLAAQAASVGVPLVPASIRVGADNAAYERSFATALGTVPADAAEEVVFGDLFLADVRAYREAQCAAAGRRPRFPLWQLDTTALAVRFIADGFRARIVCVDTERLPASLAGRPFDEALLAELPEGVDPCGENGEFHTFVTDGPGFSHPVGARTGEVVQRDGFVFCDLLPA